MEHLLSISGGALREKAFWRATPGGEFGILSGEWGKNFRGEGFLCGGRCAIGVILAQQGV
jgi:hypothetical protein